MRHLFCLPFAFVSVLCACAANEGPVPRVDGGRHDGDTPIDARAGDGSISDGAISDDGSTSADGATSRDGSADVDSGVDVDAGPPVECDPGERDCGGVCVSTVTDLSNCGDCGVVCASGPHSVATCSGVGCGLVCDAGYADCSPAAGCESALTTSTDCGACGVPCEVPSGGTSSCATGTCMRACGGGRMLCDTRCANLMTDSAACGSCGTVCTAGRTCTAGMCDLRELLYWINQRRTAGAVCDGTAYPPVAALGYDLTGRLDGASQRHASDMAANMFLASTGTDASTPTTRLAAVAYTFSSAYEIYTQGTPSQPPMALVDWLMTAPSICPVLMGATFTEFGAGASVAPSGNVYYSFWLATPG